MPKLTFEEFCNNLHNWMIDNNIIHILGERKEIIIDPKLVPQLICLLEEWDEFLVSDEPRVKKMRQAVSTFCEKIVDSKTIDVGVRARASKFLVTEPVDPHRLWGDDPRDYLEQQWDAIPEDVREEAQREIIDWEPNDEDERVVEPEVEEAEGDDGWEDNGEDDESEYEFYKKRICL